MENPQFEPAVYYAFKPTATLHFPLSLDPKPFMSKPQDADFAAFTEYVKSHPPVIVDGPTLVDHIQRGCIFAPAVFKPGTKDKQGWVGQQMIVLDLDDGTMSCADINRRLLNVGTLHPNLVYTSWSHTKEIPKHHLCFVFDGVISDIRLYALLANMLFNYFPEADPKVLEPQANVNGSHPDSVVYADFSQPTSLLDFIGGFIATMHLDNYSHFSQWLDAFCHTYYLHRLDATIDMAVSPLNDGGLISDIEELKFLLECEIMYSSYTTNSHTGIHIDFEPYCTVSIPFSINQPTMYLTAPKFPKREKASVPRTKTPGRNHYAPIGEDGIQALHEHCRLFNEFLSGEIRLNHDQRFGLLTNLAHTRDGFKWFKKGLDARNDYSRLTLKKAKDELTYIERAGYRPTQCENVGCPYLDSCERRGVCPIHQIPTKRHEVRKIRDGRPVKGVDEIRNTMAVLVADIYERNDNQIYVIATDTGIGKTESFLNLPLKSTYVGFPTHQLKDEAVQRALDKGHTGIFVWPKRPVLPAPYEGILQHLEAIDLVGTVSVLRRALETLKGTDYIACGEYLDAVVAVQNESLVFGTHDKAFGLRNPGIQTFIIDEDFSSKVFDFSTVNQQDVSFLLGRVMERGGQPYRDIQAFLEMADAAASIRPTINDAHLSLPAWNDLVQECHWGLTSPVIRLATCHAFMRSKSGQIIAVEKRHLLPDRKYIIFSATADKAIYQALFGDRLEFVDLRGTRQVGKSYLHRRHSYSKYCIERMGRERFKQNVTRDREQCGFDGAITHKDYCSERDGRYYLLDSDVPVFAWFGNLEGFDVFKGKNVAVYGVPHLPEEVYRLYAFLITGQYDESYCQAFAESLVERNEWEFTLMSSPDSRIQEIQLHAIESQLIQAAGRSRYITEDCEVHLFGNFPLAYCHLVD